MLAELNRDQYNIHHLLKGDRVNIEIKAIVAGASPGWVFVDDNSDPKTALVFSHGQGGFYFLGKEDNLKFTREIAATIQTLFPRLEELGINYFEYSGTSIEWEARLEDLFVARDYDLGNQYVYIFPDLAIAELPENAEVVYQVERISEGLFANLLIDTSFIEKNILDWWVSFDDFFSQGAGYCVVYQGKAVALCFSSFVAGEEWALGVYTHQDCRQRGFAMAAGITMVEHCKKNSISPYWDCMDSNTASRSLAESLGFRLGYVYKVYSFRL